MVVTALDAHCLRGMPVDIANFKNVAEAAGLRPARRRGEDPVFAGRGGIEDFKCLELLVRLAQLGSFTKAAEQCGISTATASKIVTRLEDELGAQLFTRSTRAVAVTEAGQLFVEKAAAALDQIDQGIDLLRQKRECPSGTVRVMISSPIGKDYILHLLAEFMNRFPAISLEICFHDGGADLIQENYSIAISDRAAVSGSFVSVPLSNSPVILMASPDYLQRRGVPKIPEDLASHDCINARLFAGHLIHPARGQLLTWSISPRGGGKERAFLFTPSSRVVIVEQLDGVSSAARAGLGIAIGYSQLALEHLRSGVLKVVLPEYQIGSIEGHICGYHIRYSNRKYLPKADRVFIDFLLEHFRTPDPKGFDPHRYAA